MFGNPTPRHFLSTGSSHSYHRCQQRRAVDRAVRAVITEEPFMGRDNALVDLNRPRL